MAYHFDQLIKKSYNVINLFGLIDIRGQNLISY
jgi:hypothetical protein